MIVDTPAAACSLRTMKQTSVQRGYTHQSEASPHWRCYSLALRTVSDLARAIHSTRAAPLGPRSRSRFPGTGGLPPADYGQEGLSQVLLFVEMFQGAIVEGLSMPSPSAGGGGIGGTDGGARFTLALIQERVDLVGLVAALGPGMSRWRAQYPDTSAALLEVHD